MLPAAPLMVYLAALFHVLWIVFKQQGRVKFWMKVAEDFHFNAVRAAVSLARLLCHRFLSAASCSAPLDGQDFAVTREMSAAGKVSVLSPHRVVPFPRRHGEHGSSAGGPSVGGSGQRGVPDALPRGKSGPVGQAAEPGPAVQVAGEDQRHQRGHLHAQGQHHQHPQSAGGFSRWGFLTRQVPFLF